MTASLNTDQPKTLQEQDRFQRYEFSKRIAKLIAINSQKSLVVGLYGKWGEGKTSVMNFIEKELPENCIVVNFNPWLFNDQEHLIKAFFDSISYELKQSLSTTKENIGKILSDYGSVVGNIPKIAGFGLENLGILGDKLKTVSTEKLKQRVDKIIRESEKKIVVFVDDIDRLDIKEIQYIFKLVKLVGDFCNTAYVLSFDDEMVAGALAPLYGDGNKDNGYQFLEKIIQVPLKIPQATKAALRNYTIEIIDNIFTELELKLTMDEVNRFRSSFDQNFIPGIDTPRLAIRYANSLFFSLPMLIGEICTTDLMLVEAIKVFFPEAYNFMRKNSALFLTDNMQEGRIFRPNSPGKNKVNAEIDKFITIYSEKDQDRIKELWMDLFPQYEYVQRNKAYLDDTWRLWYKDKKICSGRYFERYFTYSIIEGDISDVFFDQFLNELENLSLDNAVEKMRVLFKKTPMSDLIFKLRLWEDSLNDIQSEKLSELLAQTGPTLPVEQGELSNYTTRAEGAKIIAQLIINLPEAKRTSQAKKTFSITNDLAFAMEICNQLFYKNEKQDEKYFTKEAEAEIQEHFLIWFKSEIKQHSFFDLVSDGDLWRIMIWWSNTNHQELEQELKKELNSDPYKAIKLIKVFTPTISSWGTVSGHEVFKSGFNENHYDSLAKLFNPSLINELLKINESYRKVDFDLSKISDRNKLNDDELANIFMQFYEKKHLTLREIDD